MVMYATHESYHIYIYMYSIYIYLESPMYPFFWSGPKKKVKDFIYILRTFLKKRVHWRLTCIRGGIQ